MKNKNIFRISIIYFVAALGIATIFTLGYFGILTDDVLTTFLIQIVVMCAIPLLLYTLLVSKNFKTTLKDVGLKKLSLKVVCLAILIGIVMYFLNTYIADLFSIIIELLGYENIQTSAAVSFQRKDLLKEFILSAVLPGICEEILHRGIVLTAGKKSTNPRFMLITSSILFGLAHLNINQFFYATIMGFIMGYIALVSDNIIPSMIVHFMNNFLSNYFYYGYSLDWPFVRAYSEFQAAVNAKFITYYLTLTITITVLVLSLIYLLKALYKERVQCDAKKVILELKLQNYSYIEAQKKIDEINLILSETNNYYSTYSEPKIGFVNWMFFASAIIINGLITISTFIWGII